MRVIHFYQCRHYDAETRSCGNWADRPPVCRGFPDGYGGWPRPTAALPEECSFRADLGQPVRPMPVEWKGVKR